MMLGGKQESPVPCVLRASAFGMRLDYGKCRCRALAALREGHYEVQPRVASVYYGGRAAARRHVLAVLAGAESPCCNCVGKKERAHLQHHLGRGMRKPRVAMVLRGRAGGGPRVRRTCSIASGGTAVAASMPFGV
jgi:hypothetical protein